MVQELLGILVEWNASSETDRDAAFVVASQSFKPTTAWDQRCSATVRLALVSSVVAQAMSLPMIDRLAMGMACLVHWLWTENQLSLQSDRSGASNAAAFYSTMEGLPADTARLASEIDEIMDGSGPRGLSKESLHALSPTLNLISVYLQLLESDQDRHALLPADAIAYLIYHTREGRFDLASMRGLLTVSSMYPLGSKVALDNHAVGTVVRSTGDTYASPIIRIDGKEGKMIDLRTSPHFITEPLSSSGHFLHGRLPLDEYSRILWRTQRVGSVTVEHRFDPSHTLPRFRDR